MAKKVKFPLNMGNEVCVRTLDDLKENYNSEKVTEYFLDGRLLTWLNDRYYEEEAEQVRALAEQGDKENLAAKLGKIFGVEIQGDVDVENLEIRREKLEKLRLITSDDNILDNADFAAFSQEELGDLLDEGAETIYLCCGKFRIPAGVKNVRYIGLNSPVVTIGGKGEIDLEASGIVFENCIFSEETEERIALNTAPSKKENEDYDDEFNGEFTDDRFFEFVTKSPGNVKLVKYTGDRQNRDSVIVVPSFVTEIGDNAFELINFAFKKRVRAHAAETTLIEETIKIPSSVKKIGKCAFKERISLKTVILPKKLEYLGESAFEECKNLEEVIFPDNFSSFYTKLPNSVFEGCINLKCIKIPDNVTSIGQSAFICCKSLTKVILPKDLHTIEQNAFSGCESLTEIILPENLKRIDNNAFLNCKELEKIYIPDSVRTIGERAFFNCVNLKEVRLPDSIDIFENAFDHCENVVIEHNGKKYKTGQIKSLFNAIDKINAAVAVNNAVVAAGAVGKAAVLVSKLLK